MDFLLASWFLAMASVWHDFWEADLHAAGSRGILLVIPLAMGTLIALRCAMGLGGLFRGAMAGAATGLVPVWTYFFDRFSLGVCGSQPSPEYERAIIWTLLGFLFLLAVHGAPAIARRRPRIAVPRARLVSQQVGTGSRAPMHRS